MTTKILIVYSSRFGQCRKIAETMRQTLVEAGSDCDVCNLETMTESPSPMTDYQSVIITASIRYGKFHQKLNEFIVQYHKELKNTLDVFIPVSLVARKAGKRTLENNNYVKGFLAQMNWQPSMINIMAGALEYPKYHLFDRWMIQFIMWMSKGEMDKTKTVDYTDWDEVRTFALEIQQKITS